MRRPRKRARRRWPVTLLLGVACAIVTTLTVRSALQPSSWQQVYATREGEIGKRTATGIVITPGALFVALPHRIALGKHVEVRYRQRAIVVPVLDVGPWNIDDEYWATNRRPAAESRRGYYRTPTNRAGIDLSDAVYASLGLRDNDYVEWRFVHRGYLVLPWL